MVIFGPLFDLMMFNRFVRSGIDVVMCGQTIGPFIPGASLFLNICLERLVKSLQETL